MLPLLFFYTMVEFNKLILTSGGDIIIDCSILDMPYFENVYIAKVVIDTHNTYSLSGASSTPVYTHVLNTTDSKSLQLTIPAKELLVSNPEETLFFVHVYTKGTPNSDVPCGMDVPYTTGIVYNECYIHKNSLGYIKEAYTKCGVPKNLIDYILRYKAFTMCIKVKDYPLAIKYWNKFINSPSINITSCNCNG